AIQGTTVVMSHQKHQRMVATHHLQVMEVQQVAEAHLHHKHRLNRLTVEVDEEK
ncbi:hypothetical protein A5819_003700, partial [Enterococcus sp. 7E2_DIV0204]